MNLNANGEWDAEGRAIVNCPKIETVIVVLVDKPPPGTPLPTYGIARFGDDQTALMENGTNIVQWEPTTYPQGTGVQVFDKRRVPRLGQNNVFWAGSMGIICEDPTIGAGAIFFDADNNGTPVSTSLMVHKTGFGPSLIQINFACTNGSTPFPGPTGPHSSSTYPFQCYSQPGELALEFVQRTAQAILDDPVLQAVKIGSQWPANPNGMSFAVTFDGRDPPLGSPFPIVIQAFNNTWVPVVRVQEPPGNVLDAGPVFAMHRIVDGRTPREGDNIGQFWLGGKVAGSPVPTGYVGWSASVADPNPVTLSGRLDTFVRWGDANNPSTHRPVVSVMNGQAMWSLNPPVQVGFPGFGKVAQTP